MYLDLVVMALLVEKPRYGYEVKKYIEQRYDYVTVVNTNTIYPILRKFLEKGYTEKSIEIAEGKPNRYVYTITDKGRKEFVHRLRDFSDELFSEAEQCMIRLVYFDWMDAESRKRLLEGREKRLLEFKKAIEGLEDFQWIHPLITGYGEKTREFELQLISDFKKQIYSPCFMDLNGNLLEHPEVYKDNN